MVKYRRDNTPGATYFFTVTLRNRQSNLLTTHINDLGEAFRYVRQKAYFQTVAIVVMHEHLHAIWQLPSDDSDYSRRWSLIKGHFTRALLKKDILFSKDKSGEYDLWQKRFWEHRIRNEIDFQRHIDYIHYNPVKHGLVSLPIQWPYSSIHRFIEYGVLDSEWSGNTKPL
jgi:putative transposase